MPPSTNGLSSNEAELLLKQGLNQIQTQSRHSALGQLLAQFKSPLVSQVRHFLHASG